MILAELLDYEADHILVNTALQYSRHSNDFYTGIFVHECTDNKLFKHLSEKVYGFGTVYFILMYRYRSNHDGTRLSFPSISS
jgi:hypothetical protein